MSDNINRIKRQRAAAEGSLLTDKFKGVEGRGKELQFSVFQPFISSYVGSRGFF